MKRHSRNKHVFFWLIPMVAFLCAAALQIFRPAGAIPWRYDWSRHIESKALAEGVHLIDLKGVQAAIAAGQTFLLDARPAEDFEAGHLPGALSMPFQNVDEAFFELGGMLPPEQPCIVYCSGEACDESFQLILFLREQGVTNTALFAKGIQAWQEAELPLEAGGAW